VSASDIVRLGAVAGEARADVVADRTRAESIEGRYGYGSPESDAAWAEHRASQRRAADAFDAYTKALAR
jgi:hypothetical protein